MATNSMATDGTRVPRVLTHDEAATLFGRTMTLVAGTTGLFALGAYVGRNVPPQLGWLWFVAAFVTLLGIDRAIRRSERLALTLLFAFGALLGFAVAPTIAYYAAADPQALWQAGGATALFVAGFGAAGYATSHDLSALARYLFLALIALVLFGVAAIFVQIPGHPSSTRSSALPSSPASQPSTSSGCAAARTSAPHRCSRRRSSSTYSTSSCSFCRSSAAAMSDGRVRPLTRTTPPGAWVAPVSHFAHQLEPGDTIVTRNPMMKSTATILGGADGVAP